MQIHTEILRIFAQPQPLHTTLSKVCNKVLELTSDLANDLANIESNYFYELDQALASRQGNHLPQVFNSHHHSWRDFQGRVVAEAIAARQILPPSTNHTDKSIDNLINNFIDATLRKSRNWDYVSPISDRGYILLPLTIANAPTNTYTNTNTNTQAQARCIWGFWVIKTEESGDLKDPEAIQDLLVLLQNITAQCEIAIATAHRERQIQIHLQEAEQAYNTLYHWTEQYRYLVEQVPSVSYLSPLSPSSPKANRAIHKNIANINFSYISPQVYDLLGLPTNTDAFANVAKDWQNYVHPDDRDRVYRNLQHTLDTGDPFFCEYRMVRCDGKIIWVSDTAQVGLSTDGSTVVLRGSVYDISDRKNTEAKLAAAQIAEAANQSKSKFLAVMSHEIRTPMNTVIGMTELLQGTNLSPQQQYYVSTIRQGGEMLLAIVDDILDFSRIEAGQMELEAICFPLQECINDMLAIMLPRAEQKYLKIAVEQSQGVPSHIVGDRGRLRQILINLVNNAIKFTHQGGVTIGISSQLIDVDTNTHKIVFDVHDTGIGIDTESINRLFQSFRQADSSIGREYGGTGLGLVICKQLCEMMGGSISVQSEVGKGSTFSFSICVRAGDLADRESAVQAIATKDNFTQDSFTKDNSNVGKALDSSQARTKQTSGDRQDLPYILNDQIAAQYPLQILVVEDHPVNREILLLMLDKMGYLAEAVSDGKEAFEVVSCRKYDLVFMDLQMPVMDGITATRQIRKLAKHQPWIVGLSANAFANSRDAALAAGMNDYVTKPLQAETLAMVISKVAQQIDGNNANASHAQNNCAPFIDVKILINLGNSIGKENVSSLIESYLEISAVSIANLQAAIAQQDFRAIDAESHSLKGGSGTFGAVRLMGLCQELQSVCRDCMKAGKCSTLEIEKTQKLIAWISAEYNLLKQSIHRVLLTLDISHRDLTDDEDTLVLTHPSRESKPLSQK